MRVRHLLVLLDFPILLTKLDLKLAGDSSALKGYYKGSDTNMNLAKEDCIGIHCL